MESFGRKKTKGELEAQMKLAEDSFGEHLTPSSVREDLESMTLDEIKEKYPVRYEQFIKVLRNKKNDEASPASRSFISVLNRLEDYISDNDNVLRPKQLEVFKDIAGSLERGESTGYVKLPTGFGKTVLFTKLAEILGLRTLVLVPSKILIHQTGERFDQFTGVEYGKYFSDEKDLSQQVTVMTYQSLVNAFKQGVVNINMFDLVVLDEAHESLGDKTLETVKSLKAIKIGFTATPEYNERKSIGNLIFNKNEIHSITIPEAIQLGMVCRLKSLLAYTETDLSGVSVTEYGDYIPEDLENAINHTARNQAAVDLYQKAFSGKGAVAFCAGVNHAREMARQFNESGINAAVISGDTSDVKRNEILSAFESGEIDVLCNAKVLIRGFDSKRASVCLNLAPTFSRVVAEQRPGRVLRIDENKPDKWAYVVDFIDQEQREGVTPLLFPEIVGASEATEDYVIDSNLLNDFERKSSLPSNDYHENTLTHLASFGGLRVVVTAEEVMSLAQGNIDYRSKTEKINAPEGWVTPGRLSKTFGGSDLTYKSWADELRSNNPDWFGWYYASNQYAEHYSPELVKILTDKRKSQEAPDGWVTYAALVTEYGGDADGYRNMVSHFRTDHPEYFKDYKGGQIVTEHISPELKKYVIKKLRERLLPSDGWRTNKTLQREYKVTRVTLLDFVKPYRKTNPEWFQPFWANTRDAEHYSPELISLIDKHFGNRVEAPDGWRTYEALGRDYSSAEKTFRKYAEDYRDDHPEWFRTYWVYTDYSEHISPQLVEILLKKFNERKPVPTGWMTASSIGPKLKTAPATIKQFVESYRIKNPDWFGEFWDGTRDTEYYSPELLGKIREKYSNREEAPDGWATYNSLASELGKDRKTVKRFASNYKSDKPDWFKHYKSGSQFTEHVSPELAEIIRSNYS